MVKFEKKSISSDEAEEMGIKSWGTWESPPPPGFDWTYNDKETFYVLEGEAEIDSEGDKLSFGPGDLVTVYPETGSCYWTVKKKIKKHYKFG